MIKRINIILYFTLLLLVFPCLLTMIGCKKRENAKNVVSFEDIKIGYPSIEGQKKEFNKLITLIESKSVLENPYLVLRQMAEKVPLDYIQEHFQELLKTTSIQDKPNILILLDRVNEMRNLNDANATKFIEKSKKEQNADILSIALFGLKTETQQAKASDALLLLKNPESVRLLTKRLLLASSLYSGGTEAKFYREELRQSLVNALGNCTDIDFSNYDPSDEQATLVVVKQCQDWLEKNQPDSN